MAELSFRPLDESEMRMYATWFDDAELRRRIEAPTPQWFTYVTTIPGNYAWMVYDGETAVGHMQFGTSPDHEGYFDIVVNPALRNQGYCKKILRAFLERPELTGLDRVRATIEPDNLASLRCLQQAGFVQVSPEPDEEGFLHFTYDLAPSHRSS